MSDEAGRQRAITLLSDDLRDEHGAIVQYLRHAWAATDDALRARLEGIARDEMWHFQWLSEKIAELGGKPSIERSPVIVSGTLLELMDTNIQAEERAIAQYRKHQSEIDDEEIKVLLERIISDETKHRAAFESMKGWLAGEGRDLGALRVDGGRNPSAEAAMECGSPAGAGSSAKAGSSAGGGSPAEGKAAKGEALEGSGSLAADVQKRLQQGIEHEYTVILKYLMQAYRASDPEAAHEVWESAIDEMKHLGWLAEGMVEYGGVPKVEHSPIGEIDNIEKGLREDLQEEEKVIAQYGESLESVDDPKLKEVFGRLKLDEVHHRYILLGLLRRMGKEVSTGLTVGSLFNNTVGIHRRL